MESLTDDQVGAIAAQFHRAAGPQRGRRLHLRAAAGERLPLNVPGIGRFDTGLDVGVERVGLLAALSKEMVEIGEGGMSVASSTASA